MEKYKKQIAETKALLQQLFNELKNASMDKISTNEVTPDRLLWEIFNKIFSILITCENSLSAKDSLTIHLIARYAYEMLVVFAYVFLGKSTNEKSDVAKKFLNFNQFKNSERKWTDNTLVDMIKNIPNNQRFARHQKHYRNLSNFAHPSMDSFMLNRKGEDHEVLMILNTTLLTIGTILEIIKICFEERLYFSEEQKSILDLIGISSDASALMKQ